MIRKLPQLNRIFVPGLDSGKLLADSVLIQAGTLLAVPGEGPFSFQMKRKKHLLTSLIIFV
jgi:hypothetical protein